MAEWEGWVGKEGAVVREEEARQVECGGTTAILLTALKTRQMQHKC